MFNGKAKYTEIFPCMFYFCLAAGFILNNGTSGVLAVSGDNGYPYTVPLSYVYDNNRIYFHSANEGHKIDAVKRNPKASFCIIYQDIVVPQKYTTYFKSGASLLVLSRCACCRVSDYFCFPYI